MCDVSSCHHSRSSCKGEYNCKWEVVVDQTKSGAWEISVWSLSFLGKWLGASDEQENGREAVGGPPWFRCFCTWPKLETMLGGLGSKRRLNIMGWWPMTYLPLYTSPNIVAGVKVNCKRIISCVFTFSHLSYLYKRSINLFICTNVASSFCLTNQKIVKDCKLANNTYHKMIYTQTFYLFIYFISLLFTEQNVVCLDQWQKSVVKAFAKDSTFLFYGSIYHGTCVVVPCCRKKDSV